MLKPGKHESMNAQRHPGLANNLRDSVSRNAVYVLMTPLPPPPPEEPPLDVAAGAASAAGLVVVVLVVVVGATVAAGVVLEVVDPEMPVQAGSELSLVTPVVEVEVQVEGVEDPPLMVP